MAVTVPDWADTLLDLVGVNWPNVDEDAYREMADALREFADDLADDGQLANNQMERLLSSGHGEAIDALNAHWGKVKGKHLKDTVSAARTIAGALDMAAGAIEAMKWKAVAELGILAGQTGLAMALIPVTGGLSALLGAGAIALTKKQLLKLITNAMQEAVGHIVSVMTEPAVAALEGMAADLVVQVGMDALGVQDGVNLDQTKQAGKDGFDGGVQSARDGLNLASAGGSGSGGKGKGFHIEHDEHDQASTRLNGVSVGIHGKTSGRLTKAKTAQGRNKGRDDIADALDPVIEKAMGALTKSAKTIGDHIGETLPKAVKQISTTHKNNDDDIRARLARQRKDDAGDGRGGAGGTGGKPPTGTGGGKPPTGGNNNGGSGNGPRGNPLTPQPGWHGQTGKGMKNHRRDALDVKHLSPEEQRKLLVDEADKLANDAKNQPPSNPYPEGKHRLKTACAGTLLHDGVLSSHTSNTGLGDSQMSTHPALKQILDQVERDLKAADQNPGNGHGKCAEVALVSDRLHQLDPDGTKIVSGDDVQQAMKGSLVYSVQIGDLRPGEGQLFHGDYKPPCRSCSKMLPLAGVIAHH
ncbi:hypothetical protein K4902_23835 [Streptomyces lateritius]|nr:hypothetical protein [Streptomyces lateritius]